MKAVLCTKYGPPEVLQVRQVEKPVPKDNEVLIKIFATSVTASDCIIRGFKLPAAMWIPARLALGLTKPRKPILGLVLSGEVEKAGDDIKQFQKGDRVFAHTFMRFGAYAEYICIPESSAIALMPSRISFEEAASLPIAALTAFNGLRRCNVTKGKTVLINGGTGGVGHFAIQIARAKGAHVTATCSQSNAELARKLGANETIGYSKEEVAKSGMKFDAILDAYGKMDLGDACRLLKRGGIYATTQIKPLLFLSSLLVQLVYSKKLTSSNMRSRPEDMEEMEKLFIDRKLYPVIEHYFTLEHSAEAFELAEFGKPRGKIIIRP